MSNNHCTHLGQQHPAVHPKLETAVCVDCYAQCLDENERYRRRENCTDFDGWLSDDIECDREDVACYIHLLEYERGENARLHEALREIANSSEWDWHVDVAHAALQGEEVEG